jgi:DNA-binding YbaB/EbfC family protein
MGTGFAKRKKEARALQEQMAKLHEQMTTMEAVGQAGNGLVTITLTGDSEIKSVQIKPECVDPEDVEGLQDLIKAAFRDAHQKLKSSMPALPPNMGF